MALTPAQAAKILKAFDRRIDKAIPRGLSKGLRIAQRYAITPPSMVPLGRGKRSRPPNPPPGPLGIRSGNLRRDVKPTQPKKVGGSWVAGLQAGLKVAYARIHELGGYAGRGRKVRIPARPYMRPALVRAEGEIIGCVNDELKAEAQAAGLA